MAIDKGFRSDNMYPYSFVKAGENHLELIEKWLRSPEVFKWYQDSDYIEDLEEGLSDMRIRMMIVFFKNRPFAFVQDYDIHGWQDHHLSYLPKGSRGIDTFIGEAEMMGQGHGTSYLGFRVDTLFASSVPAIGIDPDVANVRAINAYKKVGLMKDKVASTECGELQLMSLINS
ncbi:MAG: acetyltransferase [Oceanicoccus sp.]|uniref:GNAT family N-acetyltransferase n=1 Tax=Oceanicoccus sp. TaxID=2691044 RepID=UPI0026064B99|nr:GNAT family N-acetyltransferase [Oceanicoccus sp.]MCP3907241.1 acetyltransferase [Oceanicoccus sp.]MDG1772636.1 GNAT family N-acetyltransferase [Oceanicoccus sp.]